MAGSMVMNEQTINSEQKKPTIRNEPPSVK
jgi:hypothetical protein